MSNHLGKNGSTASAAGPTVHLGVTGLNDLLLQYRHELPNFCQHFTTFYAAVIGRGKGIVSMDKGRRKKWIAELKTITSLLISWLDSFPELRRIKGLEIEKKIIVLLSQIIDLMHLVHEPGESDLFKNTVLAIFFMSGPRPELAWRGLTGANVFDSDDLNRYLSEAVALFSHMTPTDRSSLPELSTISFLHLVCIFQTAMTRGVRNIGNRVHISHIQQRTKHLLNCLKVDEVKLKDFLNKEIPNSVFIAPSPTEIKHKLLTGNFNRTIFDKIRAWLSNNLLYDDPKKMIDPDKEILCSFNEAIVSDNTAAEAYSAVKERLYATTPPPPPSPINVPVIIKKPFTDPSQPSEDVEEGEVLEREDGMSDDEEMEIVLNPSTEVPTQPSSSSSSLPPSDTKPQLNGNETTPPPSQDYHELKAIQSALENGHQSTTPSPTSDVEEDDEDEPALVIATPDINEESTSGSIERENVADNVTGNGPVTVKHFNTISLSKAEWDLTFNGPKKPIVFLF